MTAGGYLASVQAAVNWPSLDMAAGLAMKQASPDCLDPDRFADPSTIRRWGWRRIGSLGVWLAAAGNLFSVPTLFAWDFRASCRILIPKPPPSSNGFRRWSFSNNAAGNHFAITEAKKWPDYVRCIGTAIHPSM